MPHSFLIDYVREQFGFIPKVIPAQWQALAEKAYRTQKENQGDGQK